MVGNRIDGRQVFVAKSHYKRETLFKKMKIVSFTLSLNMFSTEILQSLIVKAQTPKKLNLKSLLCKEHKVTPSQYMTKITITLKKN